MMNSYLSLAWKEIKAQKVTSVLILIAMVLSATATAALGQSVGILQFMRVNQAASLNGDRYASFHQLTEEQNEKLHSDGRLKDVGSISGYALESMRWAKSVGLINGTSPTTLSPASTTTRAQAAVIFRSFCENPAFGG